MVVVDCWPFAREISDNRTRICLQIPDYYRKFSYDTHTRIVNIYKVSSYRICIYEKMTLRKLRNCCEKTCDIVTFTININLSYFKMVNVTVVGRYDAFTRS